MENKFELALRGRLRFDTSRGQIDTEELWSVPLTSKDEFNLDSIAKVVARKIRADEEESFVTVRTTANDTLELKLDIVKHIIATKLNEANEAANAAANKARKATLIAAIANKENEALNGMTADELKAELAKL